MLLVPPLHGCCYADFPGATGKRPFVKKGALQNSEYQIRKVNFNFLVTQFEIKQRIEKMHGVGIKISAHSLSRQAFFEKNVEKFLGWFGVFIALIVVIYQWFSE